MKIYLLIVTCFFLVISNSLYAKSKGSIFNIFGKAISVAADGATLLNEAIKFRPKNAPRDSYHYENSIITEEFRTFSSQEMKLKIALANSNRKLAWEKAKDNKHKEAIDLYKKSLEQDANSWKAWHGYGWSFSELGMLVEAENAFKMAINLGAQDKTWRYLGWNFERRGKVEHAIDSYKRSLMINSKNKKSQYALNNLNKKNKKSSWYTVIAHPSLTVRSKPTVEGNKIGSLPANSKVKLIKLVGKKQSIGGRSGRWAYIEYRNTRAYVFSAHLKK
ncbi:MAG: SH3 domain-containing protein [Thiotrichaceae bacterium]|nr:SH3 domain-containing protein [Thiotrichaceae bacterium]